MTLRVSRDSGRTWGPLRTINIGDPERLPQSIGYPPCQCPQHRAEHENFHTSPPAATPPRSTR